MMSWKPASQIRIIFDDSNSSDQDSIKETKKERRSERTYGTNRRTKQLEKKWEGLDEESKRRFLWNARLDSNLKSNIKIIKRDEKVVLQIAKMDSIQDAYFEFKNEQSLANSCNLKSKFESIKMHFENHLSSLNESKWNTMNAIEKALVIRSYKFN